MFIGHLLAGVSTLISTVLATQCGTHQDLPYPPPPPPGPSVKFGDSSLGTLAQKPLPKFLTNNPLPYGFPWGNRDCRDGDQKTPPNTGVTRSYDFTISRGNASPDGVPVEVILINGQFPGPTIEANWGDYIQVTVHNNITGPEEGTSLHWHGLLQKETPWMDGVPSISQCPIAPGSTFVYRFRADVFGTGWYHSHYSAQYLAGVLGPMVIYGPTHTHFDEDLGPIMLQDWFHTPYFELAQNIMSNNATQQVQSTNNILIDGRMPFNCSLGVPKGSTCGAPEVPYSKFRVQTGKTYKLRLVNSGAGSLLYFSIDNHHLKVIANDYVDVQPYDVTQVVLGTGQRSDVLFTPKGDGTIWMRTIAFGKFCGATRALQTRAKAIIFLDDTPETTTGPLPTTSAWPDPIDNGLCANDPLNQTIPYSAIPLPAPSVTYNITINQFVNETGQKLFYMNGNSFQGNYNDPILLLAQEKNYSYPYDPKWNVVNFGTNTSIRIVVYNNNTSPHPMHLHGHDFYVLHDGAGPWDGTSIVRPSNPQRRDTHNLAPFGHMVIQFDADNPGTWPFHCHIAFHLSQGLFMTFMERPTDINQLAIPQVMAQTCTDWDAYTGKVVVNQIDSGLKKRERVVRKRG